MISLVPTALFALASSITPGPNNMMIMSSGLNYGIKKSIPHYLGICLGFPLMVFVMALGIGVVFDQYPWVSQVLKYVGSAYMLYFVWLMVYNARKEASAVKTKKPLSFLQASAFQWVNPKAWLMGVGAIAIFQLSDHFLLNAIILSMTFLVACLFCTGTWLVGGAMLQRFFNTEKRRRIFNYVMAALLFACIMFMLFE